MSVWNKQRWIKRQKGYGDGFVVMLFCYSQAVAALRCSSWNKPRTQSFWGWQRSRSSFLSQFRRLSASVFLFGVTRAVNSQTLTDTLTAGLSRGKRWHENRPPKKGGAFSCPPTKEEKWHHMVFIQSTLTYKLQELVITSTLSIVSGLGVSWRSLGNFDKQLVEVWMKVKMSPCGWLAACFIIKKSHLNPQIGTAKDSRREKLFRFTFWNSKIKRRSSDLLQIHNRYLDFLIEGSLFIITLMKWNQSWKKRQ